MKQNGAICFCKATTQQSYSRISAVDGEPHLCFRFKKIGNTELDDKGDDKVLWKARIVICLCQIYLSIGLQVNVVLWMRLPVF